MHEFDCEKLRLTLKTCRESQGEIYIFLVSELCNALEQLHTLLIYLGIVLTCIKYVVIKVGTFESVLSHRNSNFGKSEIYEIAIYFMK